MKRKVLIASEDLVAVLCDVSNGNSTILEGYYCQIPEV